MSQTVLYLRQSLDKTGEGLGVARQETECRRLCEYREWPVDEVIRDNDRSASIGERPGYQKLLRMIAAGQVSTVVVLRIDRLLRKMTDLEELIELSERTGVQIATVEGDVNLNSVMGRQIARIMASIARGEVETKSARQLLANEQRAKAGLPHAGRRAYGYELDGVTIREDEALILKELANRFINGHTYTELADWLNSCGYTTTMGNKFYSVAIRQLLMRKRYVGIREHDGVEYSAQWTPIFDEDTWARIQYRIRERSASINFRPMPRRHLLTGLVFCGSCGAPMNGTTTYDRKTGEPRKTYRCNRNREADVGMGCGRVSRGGVPLEWFIKELIIYRLDSPDLGKLLDSNKSAGEMLQKQAALETRLIELLDDFTDGTLSKPEYKRAKERTTASLVLVQKELDQLSYDRTVSGLLMAGESVAMRWEQESDGWRRQLIDLLVERITVNPTRKLPRIKIEGKLYYFATDAIDIQWRI